MMVRFSQYVIRATCISLVLLFCVIGYVGAFAEGPLLNGPRKQGPLISHLESVWYQCVQPRIVKLNPFK